MITPLSHHTADVLIALAVLVPLAGAALAAARPSDSAVLPAAAALPALVAAFLVPAPHALEADWLLLGARLGTDEWTPALLTLTATVWLAAGAALPGYAGRSGTARLRPFHP